MILYNIIALGLIAGMLRSLCLLVGPEAWSTPLGSLQLSGIALLSLLVSLVLLVFGRWALRVNEKEVEQAFSWLGLVVPVASAAVFLELGRAILLVFGVLESGGAPPGWISWVFN